MIKKFFFALTYLSLILAAQSAAQSVSFPDDSVHYAWPTNASSQLSSTFAETRSAHLHAGIDIRTWGREGYKVFAARDGVVYRIGTGPHGYGNVIYLKHGDGSFSIYAHLNRFEPVLQAKTDSIRFINHEFVLNKNFEEYHFQYKKGDLIGYTGSTGVGPPHLHFELRTPDYKPFNPLLTNLTVLDNIPPVFAALAIEHLHPETLHKTGHRIVSPKSTDNGITDFGSIVLNNPAGLAVNAHDRANNTPNVYAVYELIMSVADDTLFHSRADYFTYEHDQMMFLDRSYPILARARQGFQRLYLVNGNTLPFYKKINNRGILSAEPGEYEVLITARDFNGNTSKAVLTVIFDSEHKHKKITSVPAYPIFNGVTMHYKNSGHRKIQPVRLSEDRIKTVSAPEPGSRKTLVANSDKISAQLVPGTRYTLYSPDKKMWLIIPRDALYDTLSIELKFTDESDFPQVKFNPDRLPVNRPLQFGYLVPDSIASKKHIGLYSYDHFRSRLFFVGSQLSGNLLKSNVREIADLRVLHDMHPPYAGRPRIEKNLADNYIIVIPVVDQMSGIDFRNSSIIVNDIRGITEYDPEKDLLYYYNPSFKPEQENQVRFTVYNRVGNSISRTVTLYYD